MRPIYGCPEKFREFSQTPPATFPEIWKGLLFRWILGMCVQNLKFVALSVPEITGGTQQNLGSPLMIRPRSIFSQIFKGLFFGWTLWIYLPNLKFVALSVSSEIIGGTEKIWAIPVYAHAPVSPKFLMAFVRMDPLNISAKFEVRSFTHSWDNRGYSKNLGSLWIRPHSLFFQIFKGLLFAWTLWIYLPNFKFVALAFTQSWDYRGYCHWAPPV